MADQSKTSKVTGALRNAGKKTAKGAAAIGGALLEGIAEGERARQRDQVRQKLENIERHELEIALEIIQERIAKL